MLGDFELCLVFEREGASERILERGRESVKEIDWKGSREYESVKKIIKNVEE